MESADIILCNGHVITMDAKETIAEAVVIREDKVVFVGSKESALKYRGSETEVVDVEGKTILPGFIESHIHPTFYGMNLLKIDCRSSNVSSIQEILELVAKETDNLPEGEWIKGFGWDDSRLSDRRSPTRWDLDKVAPNHPVALQRTCGHVTLLNSKALELNNITKTTESPQGGHLQLDPKSGELDGIVQENAIELFDIPGFDLDEIYKGMMLAQKDFAKWGITTVHDMSMQNTDLRTYMKLLHNDDLHVRIRPWIWAKDGNGWYGLLNQVLDLGLVSGFGNELIQFQGMKFMLDGSVGGRTAAVNEPYENDTSTGILYNDTNEVSPLMLTALQHDLRIAVHAIGERAIEVALQSLEQAQEELDITGMRNRIEHCGLPTDDHLKRIRQLQLVVDSSIGFIYDLGDSYVANLGKERMKRVYPHKSFKEYDIIAPGNSDLPITNGNPWCSIYSAVTRKTASGQVVDNVQQIGVYDALKMFTSDAAYSSFEEDAIGVIQAGAKADLIVISDNPLKVEQEALTSIETEQTYMNGKLIYNK